MKRTNTWQDAYNTGTAIVDLGDGIQVPLPLDGIFPGEPGPPGAGVPEGGSAGQIVRKNSAGTATYWETPSRFTVGLGEVDNTPDSDKPVSDPQRQALAAKADLVEGKLVIGQVPTLPKSRVGLGEVDNTPDSEKPVSAAQAQALATKADLVYGKIPATQLPETVVIGDSTVAPVIDAPVTGAAIDARINKQVAPQVQQITAEYIAGDRAVADSAAAAVNASPKIVELETKATADRSRLATLEDSTVICASVGSPPGAYTLDSATRGQWSFEQTLGDASGGNWVLKQYSTLSGSFAQPGRFGTHALGGGIYQNLGVDHVLSSTGADNGTLLNGTVECWIKTVKPTAIKVAVSHLNWYWLGVTVEGKATARYGHGSTEKALNGTTVLHGADLASAPWQHLALVFSGGVAHLYVNGKLEGKNTATADTRPDPDGGFTVGGLRSTRAYDWWSSPGVIDEVRVSRTARYTPQFGYPPRPAGLRRGGALFIGPIIPPERQPFDQWIRTETV